jgi:hypothetical protein
LYEAVSAAAAALEMPTTNYAEGILRAALRRGLADTLAQEGASVTTKRRPRARLAWTIEGAGVRATANGPYLPATYKHGPFTLQKLGRNLARGGEATDGWWLSGPNGDHFLGAGKVEAVRRASEMIRVWEAQHA